MQMPGCSNNTASDPFRNCSSSPSIIRLILSPLFVPRPCFSSSSSSSSLPARHSTRLCHRSVLLLEPLAESLGALEELVDAAHDAALLLGEQRLGSEVGDAVGEAALDEVGVHLRPGRQDVSCCSTLLMVSFRSMDILGRTFMKSFICLRSMRPCSSRCSAAFSLLRALCQSSPLHLQLYQDCCRSSKVPRAFRWEGSVGVWYVRVHSAHVGYVKIGGFVGLEGLRREC
jgi:hypothetical protein